MKTLFVLFGIILVACSPATKNKVTTDESVDTMKKNNPAEKTAMKSDTGWVHTGIGTVYERKDAQGRVVERYGNTEKKDDYGNFREFYQYNEVGLFTKYVRYGIESDDCIIKNKDAYNYNLYFYDDKRRCIRKEEYWLFADEQGVNKYRHKLVRIYDFIKMEEKMFLNPINDAVFQLRKLGIQESNFIPNPKKWSF